MAIIKGGATSNLQEVDASLAARVSVLPSSIGSAGGRYALGLTSNLVTVLSAFTATAGHVGAFRWGSTTKTCLLDYMRISIHMVVDFAAAQRIALEAHIARAYTASHAGGVAAANVAQTIAAVTGNNSKLRTSYPTTGLTDARLSDTADLTAGTHVIDGNAFLQCALQAPAAGTTVQKIPSVAIFDARTQGGPIVLAQDEGIVIGNRLLWAATGTGIVTVDYQWRELLNADVPSI